jgi:hypothetical protein
MAQNAYADYQKSRQVLNFLLSYQQGLEVGYALHIVPDYEDEEFGNWRNGTDTKFIYLTDFF